MIVVFVKLDSLLAGKAALLVSDSRIEEIVGSASCFSANPQLCLH